MKTIPFDTFGTPGVASGSALNSVHPSMQNTTPNSTLGSVGVAMLGTDPALTRHNVHIQNDWHKNIKR